MIETKIIGFYGYSGSGKTKLIEQLITDLKNKGYALAVVKQSDKSIRMDAPGKDTYRFQDAGAGIVALNSLSETDIIVDKPLPLNKTIEIIIAINDVDLILIESATDPDISKIRIGDIEERVNTIWTYDGDYQNLLGRMVKYCGGKNG